jgi:hypothetical protein
VSHCFSLTADIKQHRSPAPDHWTTAPGDTPAAARSAAQLQKPALLRGAHNSKMLFTTTPAMLLAVASLQHGLLCSSSCCSEAGAAQAGRLITALLSSSSCGAAGTQRSQQQQMLHTSCTPAAAAAAAAPTPPPPQQQQQPTADKLRALLAANEQFVPRACARSGEPLSAQDRAALAAFRRFNISQPLLRNQVGVGVGGCTFFHFFWGGGEGSHDAGRPQKSVGWLQGEHAAALPPPLMTTPSPHRSSWPRC